jgi:hypothetical protein
MFSILDWLAWRSSSVRSSLAGKFFVTTLLSANDWRVASMLRAM